MAVLFISHSSRDDAPATALERWLKASGFGDIFIDHDSIAGGDKWREALRSAAGTCRVVVFLVTPRWLASSECFGEFSAAWYMGRRLVPLFLIPDPGALGAEERKRLDRVCGEDQGIDLLPCVSPAGLLDIASSDAVAARLQAGLKAAGANTRVGLDPEAFAIDKNVRSHPFPGLASFGDEDADAAIFYGRSREIAATLEILRSMRAMVERRPLVILGASGAGKSSLLKAGLIPRLRREAPAWLPLRAFRPGADPLLNFAEAMFRTLADFGQSEAHGVIRDRLLAAWMAAARDAEGELTEAGRTALLATLEAEGDRLRSVSNRPSATILISVDQAEELARSESDSGQALADYLRVALASEQSPWQLAFTIRTDSFPELQRHRRFQSLEARGYDLRAIPVFRFDSVVEEPAKRYGVDVDPALVDALMEDAPKDDALPLLAFALQRLWHQYAVSGRLLAAHYKSVGGLNGLIEDAAERGMHGLEPGMDVPLPPGEPTKRIVEIGRSTFVPAMVQINDQGATIRRVPAWSSFSEDSRELLARFERWRLVVRKGEHEGDGGTVEVAHEALFREWSRLKAWLEPERARLEELRALHVDAAAWDRGGRDSAKLNHREGRLVEVEGLSLSPAYERQIGDKERAYLAACRSAQRKRDKSARRNRALIGLLSVGVIGVGGLAYGGFLNPTYLEGQVNGIVNRMKQASYKPEMIVRECTTVCPEMVVLPPGEFMMGSPDNEQGRDDDEGPLRKVTIARPFMVSKFEVTFAEWDAWYAAGGCSFQPSDQGWGRGNRPVINVSWNDIQQYVRWLSVKTGVEYRLLTEAEWEYAARGITDATKPHPRYSWDNDIGINNANCDGCKSQWDDKQTAPVGSFKPNPFGLHDMHGNVWEWVQDCYVASYRNAPSDGSAVVGDASCSRVLRGGSWNNLPQFLRAAERGDNQPGNRDYNLGFRLARTLPPTP